MGRRNHLRGLGEAEVVAGEDKGYGKVTLQPGIFCFKSRSEPDVLKVREYIVSLFPLGTEILWTKAEKGIVFAAFTLKTPITIYMPDPNLWDIIAASGVDLDREQVGKDGWDKLTTPDAQFKAVTSNDWDLHGGSDASKLPLIIGALSVLAVGFWLWKRKH